MDTYNTNTNTNTTKPAKKNINQPIEESQELKKLVLFNDEYNTFDYVIESLVDICNHTFQQAEQCTLITHYNGKCVIKTGKIEKLNVYCSQLTSKGLIAEIQS